MRAGRLEQVHVDSRSLHHGHFSRCAGRSDRSHRPHWQRAMHCPCVFAGTFAHDSWHCAATLVRVCDCKKLQALVAVAITRTNVSRNTDIQRRYHALGGRSNQGSQKGLMSTLQKDCGVPRGSLQKQGSALARTGAPRALRLDASCRDARRLATSLPGLVLDLTESRWLEDGHRELRAVRCTIHRLRPNVS
jgi:hypothetical protein